MSKKRAKSEQRDVDLPDWADEVTPSDEVMRKFYAPTGAFKSGPITVQEPPEPFLPPDVTAGEETGEEVTDAQVEPLPSPEPAPPTPPTSANLTLAPATEPLPEINSLPPTKRETNRRPLRKAADPGTPPELPVIGEPEKGVLGKPQVTTFEEFARRWSKYLYTGQLAVMRELYNLTIARGTTDCFTRYSEIAAATKMSRRNCINVVNSLVDRGFVERLEVRNDAIGKGIKLRIHPEPQS